VTDVGLIVTATAWTRAKSALAVFVGSAILVAVIVTLWELVRVLGAV
jgi:hypothetical protein